MMSPGCIMDECLVGVSAVTCLLGRCMPSAGADPLRHRGVVRCSQIALVHVAPSVAVSKMSYKQRCRGNSRRILSIPVLGHASFVGPPDGALMGLVDDTTQSR